MHYIITDIHNDSWRFMKLLEKINLTEEDHIYLLGDLFDRCTDHPDPAGVYFQVLKLGKKCTVIRGNHDHWLAHACTAEPGKWKLDNYYLMGDLWYKVFLHEGVHGYISVCGHQNMGNGSIWKNKKENVYLCDCGCGFENGRLGCLCLETKETFYA